MARTMVPGHAVRDALGAGSLGELLRSADPKGPGVEVLRERPDCLVLRVPSERLGSVVAKVWARPGVRGVIRRGSRLDPAACEHRALVRLGRFGATVPRAIGYGVLPGVMAPYTDAVFMEDLGRVESATEFFKGLIAAGRADAVNEFEEGLIGTTRAILSAGFVDSDHSLVNMVVPETGRPVRLDFELARRVPFPTVLPGQYGRMVGRLIGTYAFAVQPDAGRVPVFAGRLIGEIGVPRRIVERAKRFVEYMLDRQSVLYGIHTRVDLNW